MYITVQYLKQNNRNLSVLVGENVTNMHVTVNFVTEGGTSKSLVCLGFVGGGGRGLPEQYNITRSRGGYLRVQIMKNDEN